MRLIVLLVASLALAPQTQQNPPVFRAGVDLVTVDVAVIDRQGKPVTGLVARDFSIVAAARPRRVVSADYVAVAAPPTLASSSGVLFPAPTSNAQPVSGRTFLFVVDIDQIGQGGGRNALKSIAEYLNGLRPDDRVGLVSVPYYTPRVDLTTNRKLIENAASLIVGASTRNQDVEMTVGEAAAIEALDDGALTDYLERIRKPPTPCPDPGGYLADPSLSCILRWQPVAMKIMEAERQHTRNLYDNLRALATAMASISGPKSLVLVSEGLVDDRDTIDELSRFADAAAKARVTLYALNLQALSGDVSARSKFDLTNSHILDHQVLLDGMSRLAIASRGEVFVVSGTPAGALQRIEAEMSGYYLLSFERDPGDRDGQRAGIQVNVAWPGAIVRARTEFTPDKPVAPKAAAVPPDRKAGVADLLRWPVPVTELDVDLDTYSSPTLEGANDVRTVLAASIGSHGRKIIATGYEITNDAGKVIADSFEPAGGRDAAIATQPMTADRQLYAAAFIIPPGRYRAKFGAIDAAGRRGSVEHTFVVKPERSGALRMSEVFIGEMSPAGFLPSPTLPPGTVSLPVRIDICGDSPAALTGTTMTLELGRPGTAPFARTGLSLSETADRRRRLASATLAIATLPPGEYLVTASLLGSDGAELKSSRVFTKR